MQIRLDLPSVTLAQHTRTFTAKCSQCDSFLVHLLYIGSTLPEDNIFF